MTLRTAISIWVGGLVLFAIAIALSAPLSIESVPGGIIDHQAAATAQEVNRIQMAWSAAGQQRQAIHAVIADIVFIGVYGAGSLACGMIFFRENAGALRPIGLILIIAALVFLITDYVETIFQFVQLIRMQGDDVLASTAATVRPIKVAAWIVTFLGVIVALVVHRFARRAA